ncbi:hypothetical protein K6U51_12725 [Vibrio fluvialis]|uniref:hypothetical protein n=1 Tax=Vibrio fluvialis TaxID=676 RepID=UPI001EE9B3B2|nr:hypothetical protein [Vibrio fluvialis]MCG6387508.1 hypothetical protein [Vibrio fluvialis]MCG6418896.1 hypothetical protein [Vibrio fluvialis]
MSEQEREYFLVQKIAVGNNDVLMEHVHSCAYIENASMEGVKLILTLMDEAGLYRDDYGLSEGAEMVVTLADPGGRGDDIWIETFVVVKPEVKDGLLIINGFAKPCHQLKQPAVTPRFFTNKQPKEILSELLPGLKVDVDNFEKSGTYHLLPGTPPSRLIRSMARDYGAACFYARGVAYFKAFKLLSQSEDFKIENGNPNADYSFSRFTMLGERELDKRVLNKSYVSWDTVEGMQSAVNGSAGAPTLISVEQAKALNNQHMGIIPLLDVELGGNSRLMPLKWCSVLFHKRLPATELNEALPERQVINCVTHFQQGNRYLCRVQLGEINL